MIVVDEVGIAIAVVAALAGPVAAVVLQISAVFLDYLSVSHSALVASLVYDAIHVVVVLVDAVAVVEVVVAVAVVVVVAVVAAAVVPAHAIILEGAPLLVPLIPDENLVAEMEMRAMISEVVAVSVAKKAAAVANEFQVAVVCWL